MSESEPVLPPETLLDEDPADKPLPGTPEAPLIEAPPELLDTDNENPGDVS